MDGWAGSYAASLTDITISSLPVLVVKVKQKLGNAHKEGLSSSSSLVDDLHQLALLGERFTEKRPKSKKKWIVFSDALDREGAQITASYIFSARGFLLIP